MSDVEYKIVDPADVHIHVCSCGQRGTTRFMTGREWYERLAKQLKTYAWTADERDSILQAAFEVSEGIKT